MGSGIAQVAATAGCEVKLMDTRTQALGESQVKLGKILDRQVEKGRMAAEDAKNIHQQIQYCPQMEELRGSALVIEAITEQLSIKQAVFQHLEPLLAPSAWIASNTSSLSLAALASCLEKPERFLGLHFFNPAPLMRLVEVVPALQSDPEMIIQAQKLMESWGKTAVVAKDTPGFIVNKVARPFYGEALRIFEEGIAPVPTIDQAMKELGGFRMGPFELMDLIGNDVNYAVTESVFQAFYYDPRYKPAFTQKRMVEAGYLGKKRGKGFYAYPRETTAVDLDPALGQEILERIVIMLINEAADTLHLNIAGKEAIDLAMTQGVNYPKGLFTWADEWGIAECVARMDALYDQYHEDRYRCSPLLRKMARHNETFYPQTTESHVG